MNQGYIETIAKELGVRAGQVLAAAVLLEDGATVPFIARYRKEATGSLDETAITAVRDRLARLKELDERREAILKSLDERGLLTDELRAKVLAAETMTVLEDVYLPFRPKRRTRGTIAKEKGLEPLAEWVFAQDASVDPAMEAAKFIDAEKGVATVEEALAGARDIIAEWVNEYQTARERIRELFFKEGVFTSKVIVGKEAEGNKFENYFDWTEPVSKAPSHRILAMRRGENEGYLILRVTAPQDQAIRILQTLFLKAPCPCRDQVAEAVTDAYKRLLAPSMETEVRSATKERADGQAIEVFAENLRQLLLAPPLGQKNVLALDPGFRTGCKVVCLDRQGKLLHTDVVYPHQSQAQAAADAVKIVQMCKVFNIEAIAVGNGTAGRETEAWVRGIGLGREILIVMVNESGASVYSASPVAREEFPDHDVTVRGAVSIGRRLLDPLAELVKIDPKSIGVGQYQHDVDQGRLKQGLDDGVVSCVNSVGVEVNTASKPLLMYVSGLGPHLAQNIVGYRDEHGPFRCREQLKDVPRLGARAFEQAAGFLRIRDGVHPLDGSAVHPESYPIVDAMAADVGCSVVDLMRDASLRSRIDLKKYVSQTVGMPTLTDIMQELAKPGRDPREKFEVFSFAEGVEKLEDLKPGMRIPGIVTNITAFGAFVDVGVHQDGLIHISQLSDGFVKDPADVVKVHQKVLVTVLEIDPQRKRISLSMKSGEKPAPKREAKPHRKEPPRKQKPARPSPAKARPAKPKPPAPGSTIRSDIPLIDQLTLGR
ncbi:MAG TPA: RNA-binding transcriptional accessory protein [Phycisphaerales bacterium]|nr:RNA-binding transcriptional accessory protein [Phycisphaerales bacterium]